MVIKEGIAIFISQLRKMTPKGNKKLSQQIAEWRCKSVSFDSKFSATSFLKHTLMENTQQMTHQPGPRPSKCTCLFELCFASRVFRSVTYTDSQSAWTSFSNSHLYHRMIKMPNFSTRRNKVLWAQTASFYRWENYGTRQTRIKPI